MDFEDHQFLDLERRIRETQATNAVLIAKYRFAAALAKPQSSLEELFNHKPVDPFEAEVRQRVREERRKEEKKVEAREAVMKGYAQIEAERAAAKADEERAERLRAGWRKAARRKYPHRFNFLEIPEDDE